MRGLYCTDGTGISYQPQTRVDPGPKSRLETTERGVGWGSVSSLYSLELAARSGGQGSWRLSAEMWSTVNSARKQQASIPADGLYYSRH